MDIKCPLCQGPIVRTASVEKPTTTEIRGRCDSCKAHVVALVTAKQLETRPANLEASPRTNKKLRGIA